MTTIDDLVKHVPAARVSGITSTPISGIEYDSRLIQPGFLFTALRGGYADGHDYLHAAQASGAVAALVERGTSGDRLSGFSAVIEVDDTRAALAPVATAFHGFPSRTMTVIGVTGTDGKTTTSHLIEAMCRTNGRSTGMIGTVEVRIGDEAALHDLRQTTPESLVVQRLLSQMRNMAVDTVVLEATSHGLALHRLDGCEFDVGVVTNITHEHLDFHGTVENYRAAKGILFDKVAMARSTGKRGTVVVNVDDEGARSIVPRANGCRVISTSYANAAGAHVTVRDVQSDPNGSSFTLITPYGEAVVRLHLPGRYNIGNALSAAGAGIAIGLTLDQIATGIESLRSVPGRMEAVDQGQPFGVIVDYAHTPEAIRNVLLEARLLATGRVLVLFGSAGERDLEKRAVQGSVAIEHADYSIFTSEDPRFEDPDRIIADIVLGAEQAGGTRGVDFECIEDRREAVAAILRAAEPGDVVVLAGKGHERSIIYGADKRPWDESEVARELLRDLGWNHDSLHHRSRSTCE